MEWNLKGRFDLPQIYAGTPLRAEDRWVKCRNTRAQQKLIQTEASWINDASQSVWIQPCVVHG